MAGNLSPQEEYEHLRLLGGMDIMMALIAEIRRLRRSP